MSLRPRHVSLLSVLCTLGHEWLHEPGDFGFRRACTWEKAHRYEPMITAGYVGEWLPECSECAAMQDFASEREVPATYCSSLVAGVELHAALGDSLEPITLLYAPTMPAGG